MSQTLSLRLSEELIERIDRFARRLGNGITRSRAGTILLDEALREEEFTGIEFRSSTVGRQPYVKRTGMAVWECIMVARRFGLGADATAAHLELPVELVQAALNYYAAYRDEIDLALQDNRLGEERLKRLVPNLRVIEVPAAGEEADGACPDS
ncbi:MAG: transcriptional regulator [Armatimonadetes bacterium]|nr:transcriptional regulator [Armatimonadota bacterium]